MNDSALSAAQLHAFSEEHLAYEIEQLFCLKEMLVRLEAPRTLREQVDKNTRIEAFALHARVLTAFCYDARDSDEDVIAADFMDDVMAWKRARPKKSPALDKATARRANKEVAHLTTGRISGKPPAKAWDVAAIAGELQRVLEVLVAHASPARLSSHVADVLRTVTASPIDLDAPLPVTVISRAMFASTESIGTATDAPPLIRPTDVSTP